VKTHRKSLVAALGIFFIASVTPVSAANDTCKSGFVWRMAVSNDHVCVRPYVKEQAAGDNAAAAQRRTPNDDDSCLPGYVWRLVDPQDHVCVTQQTRNKIMEDSRAAGSRISSPGQPRLPTSLAGNLKIPLPPADGECHYLQNDQWRVLPCVTKPIRAGARVPGPPGIGVGMVPSLTSVPQWVPSRDANGRIVGGTEHVVPLVYGGVSFSFTSDPLGGFAASTFHSNEFTFQVNTNYFFCTTCANGNAFAAPPGYRGSATGDQGWVQFTDLSSTGGQDQICIWQFDITVDDLNYATWLVTNGANGNQPPQAVYTTCIPQNGAPSPQTIPSKSLVGPNAAPNSGAAIFGYIQCPSVARLPKKCLNMIAVLPWTGITWHLAAEDLFGLNGSWGGVSGGLFGPPSGNEIVFQNVQIESVLTAYSCLASISTNGVARPCPAPSNSNVLTLEDSAVSGATFSTGETNNLTIGTSAMSCQGNSCSVTYTSLGAPKPVVVNTP
jgi:hypothetical protein